VTDQESWDRAKRISRETLDGKLWLPEVSKATHYHASYVHPYWVRAMKKNAKIGLHHFYRPRKWGDGADAPSWGSAAYTADAAAKM
jgi:spore germination cell wall hydrolase CwlJ-like protein